MSHPAFAAEKPPFKQCLYRIGGIYIEDNDYVVTYPKLVTSHWYKYTAEELAATDERLPELLKKLDNLYRHGTISLAAVMHTLEIWDNPPVLLRDIKGETHAVRAVHSVSNPKDNNGIVRLNVHVYHYFKTRSFPFVTFFEERDISIDVLELNKKFPGWSVRYDLLGELAGNEEERIQTLFQPVPKVRKKTRVTLPDVAFD